MEKTLKTKVVRKSRLKPFEELTIPQQKKRIVRDAIAQINSKNIEPTEGEYLAFEIYPKRKQSLQDIIASGNNQCTACAKGAIFASCVLNVNKVYGKDSFNQEYFMKNKLTTWFTPLELDMIEAAFEVCVVTNDNGLLEDKNYNLTKLGKKCIKFGGKYKNTTNRLLAILNNILENKVFTP